MPLSERAHGRGDPPPERIASSVAITASAQLAAMGAGTVVAVLVVAEFGKGAASDGVFAAYGIYTVLIMLAQSVRVTMVARLIEGAGLWDNLDRFVGAMVLGGVASGVVLVALGAPLADVLVGSLGDEATETARTALAILWAAASLHLLAAILSAALGALGDFTTPGLAYALGGLASIASLLSLEGELGIDAVATAVALGSVLTFCVVAVRLVAAGYRPHLRALIPSPLALRTIGQIVLGAVGQLLWQVAYVTTLAFAARLDTGEITIYSYAFFAAMVVVSITSSALGIVLAAPLTRTWGDDPRSLEPHERRVLQTGLVVIVPTIAVGALVGDEVVDLLLGSSLGAGDADDLALTFVCLVGVMLASSAAIVPGLAAFARAQYFRVAGIAGIAFGIHVLLTVGLFTTDRVWALAIAASLASLSAPALLLVLVHGAHSAGRIGGRLLSDALRFSLLGCLAWAPAAVLAFLPGTTGAAAAAAAFGLVLFALAVRSFEQPTWVFVTRPLEPLLTLRRKRADSAPPPAAR